MLFLIIFNNFNLIKKKSQFLWFYLILFYRNFFTKRPKEESQPGWKLFGKLPPISAPIRDAKEISSEFQARQQRSGEKSAMSTVGKHHAAEIMSTTALIFENGWRKEYTPDLVFVIKDKNKSKYVLLEKPWKIPKQLTLEALPKHQWLRSIFQL